LDSKIFKIWWYPEDLLVLASVYRLHRYSSRRIAEVDELLKSRICASPESTLIMGRYKFEDVERDHKAENHAAFKGPEIDQDDRLVPYADTTTSLTEQVADKPQLTTATCTQPKHSAEDLRDG
jgi:hypothetical protein